MNNEQSLGRNSQIQGDCGKTLKFTESSGIHDIFVNSMMPTKYLQRY